MYQSTILKIWLSRYYYFQSRFNSLICFRYYMKVGVVKTLIGHACVVSGDGSTRRLTVGDDVYQSEVVSTGASSAIELDLIDDSTMALGRNSEIKLSEAIF